MRLKLKRGNGAIKELHLIDGRVLTLRAGVWEHFDKETHDAITAEFADLVELEKEKGETNGDQL